MRSLLPHRLAVPALQALDAARGGRPDARAQMEHLLGGIVEPDELDRLARRHRNERAVRDDLLFRPSVVRGARITNAAPLHRALEEGRGAVVTCLHLDAWFGIFPALAAAGFEYTTPVTPADDLRGRSGLAIRQHRRYASEGGHIVDVGGSLPRLVATLRRGGVVLIAWDVRGDTDTFFLGRTVGLADGAASLASTTGAPLVVAQVRRSGPRPRLSVDLDAPIDTGGREADELHRALAARMEAIVLERPAALEAPTVRWTTRGAPSDDTPRALSRALGAARQD